MFDRKTYQVLKCLYKKDREELNVLRELVKYDGPSNLPPEISALLSDNLVVLYNIGGTADQEGGIINEIAMVRINIQGRAYVEQKRVNALTVWLPYAITTVIAILSLVLSIIELLG